MSFVYSYQYYSTTFRIKLNALKYNLEFKQKKIVIENFYKQKTLHILLKFHFLR